MEARVISDDGAIFLKSVNLILTAVKSVPPRRLLVGMKKRYGEDTLADGNLKV